MNFRFRVKNATRLFREVMSGKQPMVAVTRMAYSNMVEKALSIGSGTDVDALLSSLGNGSTQQGYFALADQGYIRNHVIAHIISDIACKCSMVRMFSEDPQTQKLLENPALNMRQSEWVKQMMINKLISGSMYAEMIPMLGFIKFMNILRPDHVEPVVQSRLGISEQLLGYRIIQGQVRRVEFDLLGKSISITDMFHSKYYHPTRMHHGLSKMISVWDSIEQNNEISQIHRETLNNDGAPKGFIAMDKSPDSDEPDVGVEEMKDIRDQINEKLGPNNRGKWAVLPRAFKFVRMALTGKEMDWTKTKQSTSIEIAIGYNYPTMLLGFAEGTTFSNVAAATRELWVGNVIPEMRMFADDIENNIKRHTGKEVKVQLDVDDILAIIEIIRERRKAAREDLAGGVTTQEEARLEGNRTEKPEKAGTFFLPNAITPVSQIDQDTGGEI